MPIESPALTWARHYLEQGFSVIPFNSKRKKGIVDWTEFQERMPTEDEIKEWFGNERQFKGMAIITGGISGLAVVDIDSHKDSSVIDKIKPFLPGHETYPLVQSQSGGWHLYVQCNGELRGGTDIPFEGTDLRANGNCIIVPPSEGYEWKRKISPDKSNLKMLSSSYINALTSSSKGPSNDSNSQSHVVTRSNSFNEGSRDETLFHVANHLIKGNMPQGEVEQLLILMGKKLCDPPFPESEILIKVKSALQRSSKQIDNIAEAVRNWLLVTTGHFLVTDSHRELNLVTPEHKHAANVALARLAKEGIIDRQSNKRGHYRIVEQSEYEDWYHADTEPLDVRLPFGLDRYALVYPGDVIVIAGVKSAGKTAVALEMIKLNMGKSDCYYHSSELVKQTFRLRINESDDTTIEDWRKVKMSKDLSTDNAKDKVISNAFNVFDYIEPDEGEYFKIPGTIAKIHRALENGVAVICLQMNPGNSVAQGGPGTKNKANIYMTLNRNKQTHVMKVEECKTFKDNQNPWGFQVDFRVTGGINIIQEGILAPELEY